MKLQNLMRSLRVSAGQIIAVALAACSANGSGPTSAPPVVSTAPLPEVALEVSPQNVESGESATLKWSSRSATVCVASGAWSGSQSLANESGWSTGPLSAGVHSYGLTCVGTGGSSSAVGAVTVGEAVAPSVDLRLQPATIQPGQTALLTWSTSNAASCAGSGGSSGDGWSGARATADSSGFNVGPFSAAGSYTYTLDCTGNGGSGSDTRILTVSTSAAAAPTITIAANPAQVQPGQTAALTWTTANASSCSASGGTGSDSWGGAKPTAGSNTSVGPFSVAGSYSYTLNCLGSGGSGSGNAIVVVATPSQANGPTVHISVDPTTVTAGVSAALSWSSANVISCIASGSWSGAQALSAVGFSTGTLTQPGTYSYTLTCTGPSGSVTDTAVLTVESPPASILSFDAVPSTIVAGQSTTLSWTATNATSCTGSGGTGTDNWSGAKAALGTALVGPLPAGTFNYLLTCSGPGGASGVRSTTVTVNAAPVAAAVVTFTATPNAVTSGGSVNLAWTTSNASNCTASGGTGSDGWSGAVATSSAGVSVGPLNTNGTYNYGLTCTGPGGASPPATVSITVGGSTPPASILSFNTSTPTVSAGQTASLNWSTSDANACTASDGTIGDGWGGAVATASAGTVVGPIAVPGTYTYGLVCSGPGGTSGKSSVTITVNPVTPPASITSLLALPNSIQTGQSTLLAWTSLNATSCAASGGSPGDGWAGAVAASSGGTVIGPISTAGTYTYTLVCTGPGGASSSSSTTVTVSAAPVGPPTVTLLANGTNPTQMQPGQSLTLSWTTTGATACSASGGTGSDAWAGVQPTSNAGLNLGAISSAGIYTYSLNCVGTGGSASASVVVTVTPTNAVDCGIGVPSVAMVAPAASVSTAVNGLCLVGCGISNAGRAIDSDPASFATMSVGIGVAAYDSLRVTDNTMSYPAGRKAGFMIAEPGQMLSLGVLGNVTVRTLLNGVTQESATTSNTLTLSALGLLSNPDAGFVGFTTTKPFNAVRLDVGSLASVSAAVNVYGACVTLQ